MMTTLLAECDDCNQEVEAKILDCDECYEKFLEQGGNPHKYDELMSCEHLVCLTCGSAVTHG